MKAQRLVLWLGLGLAITSILYPPWERVTSSAEMFLGYAWIFTPPPYSVIALSHLAVQTALVGAALAIAYFLAEGAEVRPAGVRRVLAFSAKIAASFVVIALSQVPIAFFTVDRGPSGAWLVSAAILFGGLYLVWRTRPPATPSTRQHATRDAQPSLPRTGDANPPNERSRSR